MADIGWVVLVCGLKRQFLIFLMYNRVEKHVIFNILLVLSITIYVLYSVENDVDLILRL